MVFWCFEGDSNDTHECLISSQALGNNETVGHVPREFSRTSWYFLACGGKIVTRRSDWQLLSCS